MKKDHPANKEYRYGCSIDCGGTPLRVYERSLGSQGSWTSVEDYVASQTFVWNKESSDYNWLPGHWLSELDPPGEGSMYYQDAFGVHVAGDFSPQAPAQPLPEYIDSCPPNEFALLTTFGIIDWIKNLCKPKKKPAPKKDPVYEGCLAICNAYTNYCRALPAASPLCQLIARKGCQAMCKDIRDTKYFEDCATPCKGFELDTQCMDCCQKMCQGKGKGSTKMCHNVCYRDLFY